MNPTAKVQRRKMILAAARGPFWRTTEELEARTAYARPFLAKVVRGLVDDGQLERQVDDEHGDRYRARRAG